MPSPAPPSAANGRGGELSALDPASPTLGMSPEDAIELHRAPPPTAAWRGRGKPPMSSFGPRATTPVPWRNTGPAHGFASDAASPPTGYSDDSSFSREGTGALFPSPTTVVSWTKTPDTKPVAVSNAPSRPEVNGISTSGEDGTGGDGDSSHPAASGPGPFGLGPEISEQTAGLLSQVIAARVESGKTWKSPDRVQVAEPPVAEISFSKSNAFGISRLGIPSSSVAAKENKETVDQNEATASGEQVKYIHIPKHALKDFHTFAKDVAREASREVATNNPYVQALCRHRAELQGPLIVPPQSGTLTLEQQLSTQREALSVLRTLNTPQKQSDRSFQSRVLCGSSGSDDVEYCGGEAARLRFVFTPCCTSGGDMGEAPIEEEDECDADEQAREAAESASSYRYPAGAPSGMSTICKRTNACDESSPGAQHLHGTGQTSAKCTVPHTGGSVGGGLQDISAGETGGSVASVGAAGETGGSAA